MRRVRQERTVYPSKFQADTFVDTLSQYLESIDSPLRRDQQASLSRTPTRTYSDRSSYSRSSRDSRSSSRASYTPSRRPIAANPVGIEPNSSAESSAMVPYSGSADSNESSFVDVSSEDRDTQERSNADGLDMFAMDTLINDLNDIDVPDDPQAHTLHDYYCLAVRAAEVQPERVYTGDCIVCRQAHTFENCPVLRDTEFLRQHYIRFCQFMNRDRSSRSPGSQNRTPRNSQNTARVNFIDRSATIPSGYDTEVDDDDRSLERDFQRGSLR